jgi:hypothetical protein
MDAPYVVAGMNAIGARPSLTAIEAAWRDSDDRVRHGSNSHC